MLYLSAECAHMKISKTILFTFVSFPCFAAATDYVGMNNFAIGFPVPYQAHGYYDLKITAHTDGAIAYQIGETKFISETYNDVDRNDGPGYCLTPVTFDAGDDAYLNVSLNSGPTKRSGTTHLYFEGNIRTAAPCSTPNVTNQIVNASVVLNSSTNTFAFPVSTTHRISLAIDLKSNANFKLLSNGTAKILSPVSIHHAQISWVGPIKGSSSRVGADDFTAYHPNITPEGIYSELFTEKGYADYIADLNKPRPPIDDKN